LNSSTSGAPLRLQNEHASSSSAGPFDHQPRTRIVFGIDAAARAGELARETGMKRVLLVTDPGVVAAGHAERVRQSLDKAGVETVCSTKCARTRPRPTSMRAWRPPGTAGIDGIIGLGGGSSMDTAKGCNFLLTNGGRMQDYWGVGKAARPMLPLIAIPTTAGTGSECQSFALIADVETHQKMACGDAKAAARIAILDPALTLSQPPRVAACTGLDALSHALETAVTKKRNALSLAYSREALAPLRDSPCRWCCKRRRPRSARGHVAGRGAGRTGHREQHARRGPRRRQSVDRPFSPRAWPGRRADAPGRHPFQRRRSRNRPALR
jgi:alcohol dehydrogenase class IV